MELLEKIKKTKNAISRRKHTTTEYENIALAWIKGDIAFSQISSALKKGGSTVYSCLAIALRSAYIKNRLIIKK